MINAFKLILIFFCFFSVSLRMEAAQKDEFGNDPVTLSSYNNVYRHFNTKESLANAQALYCKAKKKNDKKLQAKALLIKIKYLDSNLSNAQFKKEAHKIMIWMRKTKNIDEYYCVWLYIIRNEYDNKNYVDAFTEINKMQEQAVKDNCHYAIQASYRMTGACYRSRLMFKDALKSYKKELAYAKSIKSPSVFLCYYSIAACEYRLGLFDMALESSRKGRNLSSLPVILNHFIVQEGVIYGVMGRYEEMRKCYEKVKDYVENNIVDDDMRNKYEILKVEMLWSEKRFKESFKEIKKLDKNDRMILLPFLYQNQGRFDLAYRAMTRLTSYRDSLKDITATSDFNMFNYKIKEQKLLREKQELSIENVRIRTVQLCTITVCVVVVFVILLIGTFILIWMQRKKNRVIEMENASKDQFIRDMSHEIRTPLNGINGFMSILVDSGFRLTNHEMEAVSEMIKKSTNQLTLILNNMLDLSDFESGLAKFTYKEYGAYSICNEAINVAEERCPENVKMRIECDVPLDMTFVTDGDKLVQVLIGLLVNACINTNEGEIVIGCNLTENRGKITYFVRDTGCGIPHEKAEEIFKRFVKLDSYKPGIGIGLTVARVIVSKMRATLKVDTNYKEGARFVIIHPLNLRKSE
jgi:signal transduction histidine kinase